MLEKLLIIRGFLERNRFKICPFILIFFFAEIIIFIDLTSRPEVLSEYFLPVGEGDGELIITPSGAKILIDGGPDSFSVLKGLEKILSPYDRYIDAVVLTHPEADHFTGLINVFKRYKVGIFISNGIISDKDSFKNLSSVIAENNLPSISLFSGDELRNGSVLVRVLSPNANRNKSVSLNESALVLDIEFGESRSLFMSDVGSAVEKSVASNIYKPVSLIKVAHHGSKNSSSRYFLETLHPELAVIEVGKNNYGHPSFETIDRLKENGAEIFRTDQVGLLEVTLKENGRLEVFKMK